MVKFSTDWNYLRRLIDQSKFIERIVLITEQNICWPVSLFSLKRNTFPISHAFVF